MSDEQTYPEYKTYTEADEAEDAPEFTKEDAEAAGWAFVHAKEPEVIDLGNTQGRVQTVQGEYRAEKTVNDKLINEFANSEEQLVKQISAYEEHLKRVGYSDEPAEPEPAQAEARDAEDERVPAAADAANELHAIESGDVPTPEPQPGDVIVTDAEGNEIEPAPAEDGEDTTGSA